MRYKEDQFLTDLKNKFPNLFREGSLDCGFYLPIGWQYLVSSLCEAIENHIKYVPEEFRHEIYVAQVKEKFGYLRFYMNQSTPYIDGAISLAESLSHTICQTCGKTGTGRGGGYLQTLCDEHYLSYSIKRKEDEKKYMDEQKERKREGKI